MENRNKGFSLVELIIVIGMLAIVGTMIVSFVAISTRTYTRASAEIDIQEEAQLTLNQIKDLVIDTNRAVSYGLEAPDPSNMKSFTVIDEVNTEASIRTSWIADGVNQEFIKEVLVIYSEESTISEIDGSVSYTYPIVKIIYDGFTGSLYYAEQEFSDTASIDVSSFGTTSSDIYLLSQYVADFNIDLSDIDNSQVDMQIDFSSDSVAGSGREYFATPTINLRNKIIVSENLSEIYNNSGVPINSFIAGIDILKNNTVILGDSLETGTSATYTALVDAQYGASEGYTWSLSGDHSGFKSTINAATGTVSIPIDEPSSTLTLTAIATGDTTKTKSIPISVNPGVAPTSIEVSVHNSGIIGGIDDVRTILTFSAVTRYSDNTTTTNQNVDWTPPTNIPSGSYYAINNGQLIVYLMADAGLREYNAVATSTILSLSGMYVSDTLDTPVNIGDLSYIAPSPLVVEIAPKNVDTLSRGSSGIMQLSATFPEDVGDVSGVTYTWEILEDQSTGFSGDGIDSFGLISFAVGSDPSKASLKADANLNWNGTYTVKVKLTAERTLNGKEQTTTVYKTISINPVQMNVSNVNTSWQYEWFMESFNYELENLSLSAAEQTNATFDVICSATVEYWPFWGGRRTKKLSDKDITYDTTITANDFYIQAYRMYSMGGFWNYSAQLFEIDYDFTVRYGDNSITITREN